MAASTSTVPGRLVLILSALALAFAAPAEAKTHDGCSGKKGAMIGAGIGAAVGIGLLAVMGGKKGMQAAVALAAVGAGALIGRSIDKRKCRLRAIADAYHLDMQVEDVALADVQADLAPAPDAKAPPAGLFVSLRDDGQQFASGSDQLTPGAAEYFGKLADETRVKPTEAPDAAAEELAAKRVVVLVGHTDDIGDSQSNAALSERRARTVAGLFRDHGIADANVYFQGAGETLPIADNRSEEGRAKNRRVEIVDLPDIDSLAAFLNRRLPRIENYRPAEERLASAVAPAPTVRPAAASPAKANAPRPLPAVATADLDFGGRPASSSPPPDIGPLTQSRGLSSFFASPAKAATLDGAGLSACAADRPRRAYAVKSLRSGEPLPFQTGDYMRGLYDTSWTAPAGAHLVALTHVTVLRDGGKPAAPPTLMIFPNYAKAPSKAAKPAVAVQPDVNVYRGERGILYRIFAGGARNLRCIDMVLPANGGFEAPGSRLAYSLAGQAREADWAPKVAGR